MHYNGLPAAAHNGGGGEGNAEMATVLQPACRLQPGHCVPGTPWIEQRPRGRGFHRRLRRADQHRLKHGSSRADPKLLAALSARVKLLANCKAADCRTAEDAPLNLP